MLQWLSDYLNASGFVPHGVCLLWRPGLLWTHVIADGLIALAYFVIPLRLAQLAIRRRDVAYSGTLWLFVAFIVMCGLTHVIGMVTVWAPIYGVEAVVKAATALVSLATAAWLVPLIPRLLEIPSPAELQRRNVALAEALAERDALLAQVGQQRERLEVAVTERTAALSAANADLERSNRELEHFAYVASHDLQEPVRKILTFLDLARPLLAIEAGSRAADYLGRVDGAARRMHRLIHDLLTLSRLERQDLERERVEPRAIVATVLSDQENALRGANADVVVAGDWPALEVSPTLLRQLLANLVDNAIKFRRSGVPLSLRIEGHALPDGGIELRIADNGRGFDPQDAEQLFRLFRRLSHQRDVAGTGIGLALCRKIVDFLGGTIVAEGVPDGGATFTIRLPARAPVTGLQGGTADVLSST
jgi:chemotaxis family two-component system sensor kinase Cph1